VKKNSFNITDAFTLIIREMIERTEEFRLFDINRILVCCSTNRNTSRGGIYGKLVPLKFENGNNIIKHRGYYYSIPGLTVNNMEILYVIYFYIPKFLDLPAEKKIDVMFHELYHINPDFNGDIRRMGKFKKAHGHSRKSFDEKYKEYAESFYGYIKNTPFIKFLEMDTTALKREFPAISYRRMKVPKPVRINKN
jgi:hypothetical protein